MPTPVSTGQITIVDTNDARPITAYITANPGMQQVLTKDDAVSSFAPSWFTANANTGLQLTAKVFVGGITVSESTALLGNRKFCLTVDGTAITTATGSSDFVNDSYGAIAFPFTVVHDTSGSYIRIKGNLKETTAVWTVFFQGDYTDPATGLVTRVMSQIMLNCVKTGSNAVFVVVRGMNSIEEATGTVKNAVAIGADLIRSSGVDITGVTYKWYEAGGATHISTSLSGYATKYGLKTSVAGTSPSGAPGELGVNVPTAGAQSNFNTLVISENAVLDVGSYKVEITDDVGKVYEQYFTVYDYSDPYAVILSSSTGDKLQNGQGITVITPAVWNGSNPVSVLTGWVFDWTLYDRNAKRVAFVDTGKIAIAGGGAITANGNTASAVFNCVNITAGMFAIGEIIKCVKPTGEAYFYEVGAASTTGAVTIRAPVTNSWLSFTAFPAPSSISDFVGGRIFGCTTQGTRTTAGAAGITVSGDEIDVKGRIDCQASRP